MSACRLLPHRLIALLAAVIACVALAAPPVTAAAAVSASTPPPALSVPLRVMSYNVMHGAGSDNVFNLDRTADAIRAQHPDVIGLQEVDDHWGDRSDWVDEPAALAQMLGMNVTYGPIYDLPPLTAGAPDRLYGVAILSRYPIVHAVNHEITRLSSVVPNPVPAPAPGFPEAVINVRGALVHIFDTHLDAYNRSVRATQVADMLAIMRAAGGQQVLVGDFNAGYEAPELAPLWSWVTDAMAAVGQPDVLTWPADMPRDRNDYVTYTSPIRLVDAFVPVTLASDHLPVVADLLVTRGDNN